jgi:hypothetical protein
VFLFTMLPFLFIMIGIINLLFPKAGWYMKYGWQFKNAEPSDAAIWTARIGGIAAIAIGFYLMTSGIFHPGR